MGIWSLCHSHLGEINKLLSLFDLHVFGIGKKKNPCKFPTDVGPPSCEVTVAATECAVCSSDWIPKRIKKRLKSYRYQTSKNTKWNWIWVFSPTWLWCEMELQTSGGDGGQVSDHSSTHTHINVWGLVKERTHSSGYRKVHGDLLSFSLEEVCTLSSTWPNGRPSSRHTECTKQIWPCLWPLISPCFSSAPPFILLFSFHLLYPCIVHILFFTISPTSRNTTQWAEKSC